MTPNTQQLPVTSRSPDATDADDSRYTTYLRDPETGQRYLYY